LILFAVGVIVYAAYGTGTRCCARDALRRVLALRDLIVVAAAAMGPRFAGHDDAAMIAARRWTWLALASSAADGDDRRG